MKIFYSFVCLSFQVYKMSQIETENVNNTLYFSQASENKKKSFWKKIIARQIYIYIDEFILRQTNELPEEYYQYIYLDDTVVIDFAKKINADEIVRSLSGVMTGGEIVDVIIKVLEEDIFKTTYN